MIISWGNISYQRSKNIERRIMTYPLLQSHICRNFIHSHMSGTLDHYLNVLFPCTLSQIPKFNKFRNLPGISTVMDRSRSKSVTKTNRNIIFTKYFQNIIIVFIERIFISRHFHPCKKQWTAPWYNICKSSLSFECFNSSPVNSGMNRLEINALLSMSLHNPEKVFSSYVKQILFKITYCVIHWNSTYHCRWHFHKLTAECIGFTVIAKIHYRLAAKIKSHLHFLHFHFIILTITGYTEVYVDFRSKTLPDALSAERFMIYVGRYTNASSRSLFSDNFRRNAFFFCYDLHFLGNNAFFGGFHLCFIIHL